MAFAIGAVLAVVVGVFFWLAGLDRDRATYALVVIVVAHYYVLFAVIGQSRTALIAESMVMLLFVIVAVLGFKMTPWLVVAGLAGHGVLDGVHGHLIANPGVPDWWPAFCLAFDVTAAAVVAWPLVRRTPAPG